MVMINNEHVSLHTIIYDHEICDHISFVSTERGVFLTLLRELFREGVAPKGC